MPNNDKNTTYPVFSNMLPYSEDFQLIVDSLREQMKYRLTGDMIFTGGICSGKQIYVQSGNEHGYNNNTIMILPFIGYNINGDRIRNSETLINLAPQSNGQIVINDENIVKNREDIPYWRHYTTSYTQLSNIDSSSAITEYSYSFAQLKAGSILQGIKLFLLQSYQDIGDVYMSIGINNDLEKYYPITKVSNEVSNVDIGTANMSYSENQENETDILITFYCDSDKNLKDLISGNLSIDLLITDLSNINHSEEQDAQSSQKLQPQTSASSWQANTTYYIVARYKQSSSDLRSGFVMNDENGNTVSSKPFYARITDDVDYYALRKTGEIIDASYDTDIKLAEVVTDTNGNISSDSQIYANGYSSIYNRYYTDYLTLNQDVLPSELNKYASKIYQDVTIINEDSDGNVIIPLNDNYDVYEYRATRNPVKISINIDAVNVVLPNYITFEFTINMQETLYTIDSNSFDSNIKWLDNTVPEFNTTGVYYMTFRSRDAGQTWVANFEGKEITNI